MRGFALLAQQDGAEGDGGAGKGVGGKMLAEDEDREEDAGNRLGETPGGQACDLL